MLRNNGDMTIDFDQRKLQLRTCSESDLDSILDGPREQVKETMELA